MFHVRRRAISWSVVLANVYLHSSSDVLMWHYDDPVDVVVLLASFFPSLPLFLSLSFHLASHVHTSNGHCIGQRVSYVWLHRHYSNIAMQSFMQRHSKLCGVANAFVPNARRLYNHWLMRAYFLCVYCFVFMHTTRSSAMGVICIVCSSPFHAIPVLYILSFYRLYCLGRKEDCMFSRRSLVVACP